MKKLLEKYLQKNFNIDYVSIDHYDIDGASCRVKFYTDISENYWETEIINIWDMLVFLNEENNTTKHK